MLELYQAEDCPYCTEVREKMLDLGVSYVIHNPRRAGGEVRNEQTQEEMLAIGGDDQIPFLVDTNREETLYESDAIIDYLEQHYSD